MPNGDTYSTLPSIPQVLLDGVAGTAGCASGSENGFTSEMEIPDTSGTPLKPTTPPTRTAKIQINLSSNMSYSFNVQTSSNLVYDGRSTYRDCKNPNQLGCGPDSAVIHFLPENLPESTTWDGDPSKENIFYFRNPYEDYMLSEDSNSGFCSYAECFVKRGVYAVQLSSVDALIFPDKEIRPTR
jgi:hypothetical protein